MATHDYVIDNGSGSTVRADINNALQAIVTVNSSNTAPSATFNKMLWHDNTENALKQYNTNAFTGLRLFSPIIKNGLLDVNGADAIKFNPTVTAVNQFTIANAATGNSPAISATGNDTNINLTLTPKGSASVFVPAGTVTNPSISISTDSNTGIYFAGADTMGFVEGGTGYQMGYRNVPSAGASKTTGYTLQLSDIGKLVTIGSGGGITVPNAVFAAGDIIYVYNDTASPFTITRGNSATLYQSGVNANVASISVPTRTMGAIQYVSSSTAVFFSGQQSSDVFQLEYVIVGGGGGGGSGGGGGGGYIAGLNAGTVDGINYGSQEKQGGDNVDAEKPIWIKKGITYNVRVGAGGTGETTRGTFGNNRGTASHFSNLVAIGGGGGKFGTAVSLFNSIAHREAYANVVGGCGGGGCSGTVPAGIRQGRVGGTADQSSGTNGGNGGGGASTVGADFSGANGGAGGNGITTKIHTSNGITLSGGGGGGGSVSTGSQGGAGGSGGGGAGGNETAAGTDGTVTNNPTRGTGGGGGGSGYDAVPWKNGNGAVGRILLRYPQGITATSSTSNNVPDLGMATSTVVIDTVTFTTLDIYSGVGTLTFS